jgi:hypothetical protein
VAVSGTARREAFSRPLSKPTNEEGRQLAMLWIVLALVILLAILGFAVIKWLLIIAVIMALVWIIGFFARGVEGARWYRW